ncbi:MAG: site-2 protease family protein, partial [Nanoarchaeota archaeon]
MGITHEFSHGIFARLHKLKIKSTGFAFLGPILGAFVEPDEKQLEKTKKLPHMSILAAGTFANLLMTILFGAIIILFFKFSFMPAGVNFNSYAVTPIDLGEAKIIWNSSYEKFAKLEFNGKNYFVDSSSLENSIKNKLPLIYAYDDSPAFKSNLKGPIMEIDGEKIQSKEDLQRILLAHKPNDKVRIKTAITNPGTEVVNEIKNYDLELGEREGKAFLGVGFVDGQSRGFIGKVYTNTLAKVKKPGIFYASSIGEFGWFIYYLLWWIVVINFLVALFNMLPLGILDGGKFFYLTVLGITKKEKIASRA